MADRRMMVLSPVFTKFIANIKYYWAQRNQRERRLLVVAGGLLIFFCLYSILFSPAWEGRQRLQKELPILRQQAAELRALVERAQGLSGQLAAHPVAPLEKELITLSLKSKNLPAQSIINTGDTAKVQLSGVAFAGLFDWLTEAQSHARWQVVDANIQAAEGATPGMVNATIVLWHKKYD